MNERLPDWLIRLNKIYRHQVKPPGHPRRQLDEEGIWKLHELGWSNRRIARELLIPNRTIDRRISEIKAKKAGLDPKRLRDY